MAIPAAALALCLNKILKLIATISDNIQAQKKGTMNENIHQSLLVDLPFLISNPFMLEIKGIHNLMVLLPAN